MILHLTTVHSRGDTRIRVKETSFLARDFGTRVKLYVQDGEGNHSSTEDGVKIVDTGQRPRGRLARMIVGAWRMYHAVRQARPTVAHFHDPELIPVGFALKLHGIKVIYDVHEDLPRQILGKHWLPFWVRRPVSWAASVLEKFAGWVFDGVVAATPTIASRFPERKTVTVKNFPILSELLASDSRAYSDRPPHFAYIGRITGTRGSREMIEAVHLVSTAGVRLQLAGEFSTEKDKRGVRSLDGWSRVNFHGWACRSEIAELLGVVRAGLVVLHPTANYPDAYPVKMFEYMAAGVPVIASDFPLWRGIVEGAGCGMLVDPLDPSAIANAMDWLLEHPNDAEMMGRRGREAVVDTYNWETQADKLMQFYRGIFNSSFDKLKIKN